MRRKKEKHLPYFSVLEALQKARTCPICDLEIEAVQRYLDSLLYESVNDGGVRADLLRSRGYCNRHAHVLLGLEQGLGIAILFQDQVRLFLGFLPGIERMPPRSLRKKLSEPWGRREHCPACRIQNDAQDRYLSVLVEALLDDEMRAAFDASPGLCAPHFMGALRVVEDADVRRCLIETERKKFEELLHDLEEFCRKHDYRFSREGFGKERDSWIRAVNMMTGRKDVV